MGYKNKKSLILLVKECLDVKLAIGSSKQQAKINGTYRDYIYSWGTYRTYLQQCCQFVRWCKQQARQDGNRQPKTLEDCKQYVVRYMQHLQQGYSAYTQKLVLSALCKLYNEYPSEGRPFDLPNQQARHRADIIRSRNTVERDRHFSEEQNADIVTFCRCTGLRRAELAQIRGIDLDVNSNNLYVYRGTKGGRARIVPIVGSPEEIETIRRLAAAAENDKVFEHIPSAMDVHHYRSVYCQRIYDQYARPLDKIPAADRYYCRSDKKGTVYDRKAMLQASKTLGHNRISVIAGHYLMSVQSAPSDFFRC